jgi:hypothetical protein
LRAWSGETSGEFGKSGSDEVITSFKGSSVFELEFGKALGEGGESGRVNIVGCNAVVTGEIMLVILIKVIQNQEFLQDVDTFQLLGRQSKVCSHLPVHPWQEK